MEERGDDGQGNKGWWVEKRGYGGWRRGGVVGGGEGGGGWSRRGDGEQGNKVWWVGNILKPQKTKKS